MCPVSNNAFSTVRDCTACKSAEMDKYVSFIRFLDTVSLQLLNHFFADSFTSLQIVRHKSSIIIIAAQHCIHKCHRQLLLTQLLSTFSHVHTISRSQNNGINLFTGKLLEHIALQLPVAVLHYAANIYIDISSLAALLKTADNLLPIGTFYNLQHSINIFASFLNLRNRLKLLLGRRAHNLLLYTALLRLAVTTATQSQKHECGKQQSKDFFHDYTLQ